MQQKNNLKIRFRGQTVKLTRRKTEIVKLMLSGYTDQEIADKLGLGKATIKTYIEQILTKTRAYNRVSFIILILKSGLINLDSLEVRHVG